MKRFALVVLLAGPMGAARAEVALYGVIDLNVNHYSAGSRSGTSDRTAMNDGTLNGLQGSRLGFRAGEDLGNGLRVATVLEAGINADTGQAAQGGRMFGRQAYISLSHERIGDLRLGRQYLFEDGVQGMSNPFCNALTLNPGTSVTNVGKNLPMWLNAVRADNVMQYRTASFGGLSAGVQYAPGENTSDAFYGTGLDFRGKALTLGGSYEWNRSRAVGDTPNRSLTLGGNYNFGSFKLLGGMQDNRNLRLGSGNGAASNLSNLLVTGPFTLTATRSQGYTLGVEAPLGPLWLVGANYTIVAFKNAAGATLDLGKAAVGARYELSKRTHLYSSMSVATGDLRQYIDAQYVVQAGIRHVF